MVTDGSSLRMARNRAGEKIVSTTRDRCWQLRGCGYVSTRFVVCGGTRGLSWGQSLHVAPWEGTDAVFRHLFASDISCISLTDKDDGACLCSLEVAEKVISSIYSEYCFSPSFK